VSLFAQPRWSVGLLAASVTLCACEADVSLGRFGRSTPEPTTSSSISSEPSDSNATTEQTPVGEEAGAVSSSSWNTSETKQTSSDDAGPIGNPAPACGEQLGTGLASRRDDSLVVTEPTTDWSLPEPTTGMAWDITIEKDVPSGPPMVGYYWHNQFSFVPGVDGRLGLQTNGIYQADPVNRPGQSETVPMVVFWLSGPPLAAELGDIPEPDARVAPISVSGLDWMTIHAKFKIEECHTYRFRIGLESTEEDGSMWYGAWVTDVTANEVTFLGRMLLPSDSGLLSTFTSSRTIQIFFSPTQCSQLYTASALFGAPVSDSGDVASNVSNYFSPPYGCRRSYIAAFDDVVRHEVSASQ
jgi:hypothetical protein